jgi:hypothetical protein
MIGTRDPGVCARGAAERNGNDIVDRSRHLHSGREATARCVTAATGRGAKGEQRQTDVKDAMH